MALLLVPAVASADEHDDANPSIATGSFLPFTGSPAGLSHSAETIGIYDGATDSASLTTLAIVKVSGHVQVQGQIDVAEDAQPSVAVQYQLLEDAVDGFDLQVTGGVSANGFNQVPAVFAHASAGGNYRGTYVIGLVGFELGTERNESASLFDLAAIRDLGGNLYMGIDSHLVFDLERDSMEPDGEASWELQAGPLVTYPIGRFELTAGFGMSAREERTAMSSDLGAYGSLGAGAVF